MNPCSRRKQRSTEPSQCPPDLSHFGKYHFGEKLYPKMVETCFDLAIDEVDTKCNISQHISLLTLTFLHHLIYFNAII